MNKNHKLVMVYVLLSVMGMMFVENLSWDFRKKSICYLCYGIVIGISVTYCFLVKEEKD